MIAPDVNILIGAISSSHPDHVALADWLDERAQAAEPLGLTPLTIGGTLRILTHPKIFNPPAPLTKVLAELGRLLAHPNVELLQPGPRHWEILERLCRQANARGNLVPDAQQAAIAIEHGATWVTLDQDFARFPGLTWRLPIEAAVTKREVLKRTNVSHSNGQT